MRPLAERNGFVVDFPTDIGGPAMAHFMAEVSYGVVVRKGLAIREPSTNGDTDLRTTAEGIARRHRMVGARVRRFSRVVREGEVAEVYRAGPPQASVIVFAKTLGCINFVTKSGPGLTYVRFS